MEGITVSEFDWLTIKGKKALTHRVIIKINGREFKRLFRYGWTVVWSEENVTGFCDNDQAAQLEGIFKAWCLENGKEIRNPQKMIS